MVIKILELEANMIEIRACELKRETIGECLMDVNGFDVLLGLGIIIEHEDAGVGSWGSEVESAGEIINGIDNDISRT